MFFSDIYGHWKHHLTFELASYFPIVGSYHSVNVVLHINIDLQSNIVLLILKKPLTRFPFMDSFQKSTSHYAMLMKVARNTSTIQKNPRKQMFANFMQYARPSSMKRAPVIALPTQGKKMHLDL